MSGRLMPDAMDLGQHLSTAMAHAMRNYEKWIEDGRPADPFNRRMVMGWVLPSWQRGLVWDQPRQIRFLESLWLGLHVGTYTYNDAHDSPFDNLLIDGQQRMHALQCYFEDQFPVFGYRWSEVTEIDRRVFEFTRLFPCFRTQSRDEEYLIGYYDRMNFGGVPHTNED